MILAAFRVRSFRFQFPADLLTSLAFEMETVILSWYVIAQTGSVLLLTVYGSLLYLGTLLSPMYGVLGDRLGGRTVLFAMRTVYVVLALILAVLSLSGHLSPSWVFVVAAVGGLVRPNDLVLRNSLIGETIPSQHLMGAVGLSRMTADCARVLGALAGAEISTVLGIGPAYLLVTVFYGASLALTSGVARRHPVPDPGRDSGSGAVAISSPSGGRDLKDGVLFVWRTPALLAPMWLAFLINLTAYPVSNGILAYTAKNIFAVGATGLGWLVAAFAFGGLLGSLSTIVTGGPRRPERFMMICTAIWYTILLAFGNAANLRTGLLALLLAGFVQNVAMISMTASLLRAAGARFRSRVMGVRMLAVYGLPLGLLAAGALIDLIGYPMTISAMSLCGLAFTLLIGIRWRQSLWH